MESENAILSLLCTDNISLEPDSMLCNGGQNLMGQPKEMPLARNISSPMWMRNKEDLHSDTECPLTYLMKLGMVLKVEL